MRVLLMAAGAGRRFFDSAQYEEPKPYVRVHQEAMCEHVARMIGLRTNTVHEISLVCNIEHQENDVGYINKFVDKIIDIPSMVRAGPAYSVAIATLGMYDQEGLLLMDSDCFVRNIEFNEFNQILVKLQSKHDGKAAVFTKDTSDPRVKNSGVSKVISTGSAPTKIIESSGPKSLSEVKTSELINIGAYWFESIGLFRRALNEVEVVMGHETKISDVFNQVSKMSFPGQSTFWTTHFELKGEFVNLGTPELLNEYIENGQNEN